MKKKNFFINSLVILGLAFVMLSCEEESQKQNVVKDNYVKSFTAVKDLPNIIFILADDLGYGDLGCYGHPYAKTPNIDQLAREGARFQKFYATGITCNPSRTAFMTGKHPASFEKNTADYGFGDHITITELLNQQGYTTVHLGKWHIGPIKETTNGEYGIDFITTSKGSRELVEGKDNIIFSEAIDFIKQKGDKPFYINIWTHVSHFPLNAPDSLLVNFEGLEVDEQIFGRWFNEEKLQVLQNKGKDINEAMQMYLAEIYYLDVQIGKLMQCLREQNLEKNTIIVFSSDQGPGRILSKKAILEKDHEMQLNMLGYAGGLRGGKHTQFEGGVRIPFIVRWPGKIPENYIDNESVLSALDFLPSLCSISGIVLNEDYFDGKDKSKTWYGAPERRNQPLFWKRRGNKNPVSILDGKWKMHTKKHISLYDLEIDPFEENDLSVEKKIVVNRLLSKIEAWEENLPVLPEN